MTITSDDIKFVKSVNQTDTDANGERVGSIEVVSGTKHGLFPRVTKAQRIAGLTRYRKEFYVNNNGDDETAYGVLVYPMRPSNAGDRFYFAKGTERDTQADFAKSVSEYARVWTGCGQLAVALSGGESSVQLSMENDDFQFPNGGYLYLSDNTQIGQTVASDARIGDSVLYSGGVWIRIAHSTNITYPYGWLVAEDEVLTITDSTNEEFLLLADNHYSGEAIGSGNGSSLAPTLATLTNVTNGVCRQEDKLPVITAVCGGIERTVNVDKDGVCSGYCSGGQLNMATGVWTEDITWTTAPDNDTDNITADYRENCFSYVGSIATVELAEQVANAYTTTQTFGSGCIYEDEVLCTSGEWTDSAVGATYDIENNPLELYNDGCVEEDWTLTFINATSFNVVGSYYGTLGIGSVGTDYEPVNPVTGQPYFGLLAAGWGGTPQAGDIFTFKTHPAVVPILICEEVPAGTTAESNNLLPVGSYTE